MLCLYLDNFRGFRKTLVPIAPVNFLVGENSTGKTSVLGLMNLLSSPNFWFSQSFNSPEHEFGGFRDILSATAPREAEFCFGVHRTTQNNRGKTDGRFSFLAAYCEREALPSLAFYGRLIGKDLLAIRRTRNGWTYRVVKGWLDKSKLDPSKAFALLQKERLNDSGEYKQIPKTIPSRVGFAPLLGMLESVAGGGKANLREFAFPAPLVCPDIVWLAPIRTKPRRTYDGYETSFSPEGEHTPYLLRRKLSSSAKAEPFAKALTRFGQASGLFEKVEIHRLGDDAAAPFEVLVGLSPSCSLRINSVGYGVSQVLPLVAEILARRKHSLFAIQQPEVHLHPRAQAALGDLIFQMAEMEDKHFVIETHSDYTIDRFRMNLRMNPGHKASGQVLFFDRIADGNAVHALPLTDNGEYPETQPPTFRGFFLKEQMDLLGL